MSAPAQAAATPSPATEVDWIAGVIDGLAEGAVVVNRDGKVIARSRIAQKMFATPPGGDFLKWTDRNCFQTSTAANDGDGALRVQLAALIATGEPLAPSQVLVAQAGEGGETFVKVYGYAVFSRRAEFVGAVVVFIDVDEQVLIQRELRGANTQLAESVSRLERSNQMMNLVTEMGDFLLNCSTLPEFYDVTSRFVCRIFSEHSGGVYVLDESHVNLEAVARWGDQSPTAAYFTRESCWALRRGRAHRLSPGGLVPRCSHVDGATRSYICLPMMAQGEALGVVQADLPEVPQGGLNHQIVSDTTHRTMISVAEHVAGALANLRLRESLSIQAIRDPLTGLFNRRYMEEWLHRELARCHQRDLPLSLLMIDLDHFKNFNDIFGHAAADEVLRRVAELLNRHVGTDGIVCRYGGEEIVVALPEASLDEGVASAQGFLAALRHLRVQYRGAELDVVTASVGVAAIPEHGTTADALLRCADEAMYAAKHAGRDRVHPYGSSL
ncbi:MAG: diguanylate cyclase [Nannocystaceae bacterium]